MSRLIETDEIIPYRERPSDGAGGKVVPIRLQKFLARSGVASRRASEKLMSEGRVTVNGQVVCELGSKVDPLIDIVAVDGKPVVFSDSPVTLMFHKPAGVITTMKAQSNKPIVADFIPLDKYPGLYPIGRLDRDTTGLLLFSTDGALGNALLHPKHHVAKTYVAKLKSGISDKDKKVLETGVELDDGPCQPASIHLIENDNSHIEITIHEGRYHQVKRMFEAVGHPVVALHRKSFGNLEIGNLKPGTWRLLTEAEITKLRELTSLNQ